jgi:hypothetical protein
MDLIVETSDGTKYSMPAGNMNALHVENMITKHDHPHPGLLVLIILVVIVLIYYIYVTRFKLDLSGEWYSDDSVISITHNKWTDEINVRANNTLYGGWITGDAVYILAERGIETSKGVYNKKKIYWTNGSIWQRPAVM